MDGGSERAPLAICGCEMQTLSMQKALATVLTDKTSYASSACLRERLNKGSAHG
jgi:hypothetical protein